MACHSSSLVARRSSPLDPRCAECFNPTIVAQSFKDLHHVLTEFGPFRPECIWNEDEKPCVHRDGRKSSGIRDIHARDTLEKYKKRAATLQIVIIIASANAAGETMTPGFIFSGASYEMDWFEGCSGWEHLWYEQSLALLSKQW